MAIHYAGMLDNAVVNHDVEMVSVVLVRAGGEDFS